MTVPGPHRWVWYRGDKVVCMFCDTGQKKPPERCGDVPASDRLFDMPIFRARAEDRREGADAA